MKNVFQSFRINDNSFYSRQGYHRAIIFGFNGLLGSLLFSLFSKTHNNLQTMAFVCSIMGAIIFLLQIWWFLKNPPSLLNKISKHVSILFDSIKALLASFLCFLIPLVVGYFYALAQSQTSPFYTTASALSLILLFIINIKSILQFVARVEEEKTKVYI
ncbi:hypothetical protein [Legionella sp. 28fT52]|uniref:hypothetical protein n=1 Tax=Legionella sp. 28fT52 TaxID=3410134 RepID=UPI003AF8F8FE